MTANGNYLETLRRWAAGENARTIARELVIAETTVREYLRRIRIAYRQKSEDPKGRALVGLLLRDRPWEPKGEAPRLLPTLEGYTHGVVAVAPLTIQCDGCGTLAVHGGRLSAAIFIMFCGIEFVPGDSRRLCAACRAGDAA